MKAFNYLQADNLDAALAEYGAGKPALKASGIDLLDLMKERIATPETVLTIDGIEELAHIREEGGGLRLGCLTTLAQIGRDATVKAQYPALWTAAAHAATPQVRERATLGGNLCQRPRCWYFRSADFHCLKKGGAMCFAVEGENQYHAIYGGGPCYIVHPSNTAVPLMAYDAEFVLRREGGERSVKAREFFVLPRERLMAENILEPGEVLVEVRVPQAVPQSATIELREKQSFDWPLVMASAARLESGWQICLGAVAPKPWLSEAAMQVAGNNEITPELAAQAGEAAAAEAEPMSDNAYKRQLVKTAVKRALLQAAGKEKA